MRQEIINKLNEIEKKERAKDYCHQSQEVVPGGLSLLIVIMMYVFIYVRKKEDYLCLDEKSDVIELPIDKVFDISGWDIKKALQSFLYKSNPSLLEWFASPIVYKQNLLYQK